MSETTIPPATRAPRKSKAALQIEQLQADLAAAKASLEQTQRLLLETQRERDDRDEELEKLRTEHEQMRLTVETALRPLAEKTKAWEWPPENVALWGKVTWGELRTAAAAYSSVMKPQTPAT
jgi:peptidoglycan hydrolase CwlO-like protein